MGGMYTIFARSASFNTPRNIHLVYQPLNHCPLHICYLSLSGLPGMTARPFPTMPRIKRRGQGPEVDVLQLSNRLREYPFVFI